MTPKHQNGKITYAAFAFIVNYNSFCSFLLLLGLTLAAVAEILLLTAVELILQLNLPIIHLLIILSIIHPAAAGPFLPFRRRFILLC